MLKICLYAICKNEIKHVEQWWSYAKKADYVVVLDTGSDDGTPEKLEELGATVYRKTYPKPFRFDVARNDSVELAYQTDADIFMTTDFDEILNDEWADLLRDNWNPDIHQRAAYDDYFEDQNYRGGLNWIHARGWYWHFPCHEVLVRNGSRWYTYDEELNLEHRLVLHHYPDHSKSRGQYLPLLKIRLDENQDDPDTWSYYLRELMYKEAWDEILSYEQAVRDKNFPDSAEWGWTLIWIATAYEQKGMLKEAKLRLYESIQVAPIFRTAYVSLARLISNEGKNEIAEAILKDCLKNSVATNNACFLDHDDVWTWRLYDWLSVVCWHQGKYEESLGWSTMAKLGDPDNEHLQHNFNVSVDKIKEMETNDGIF